MAASKKIRIAKQALNLFIRFGTQAVSMDDIANQCGMSKRTLYKEFDSKVDLLDFILINEVKRFNEQIVQVHDDSNDAIEELLNFSMLIKDIFESISPSIVRDLKRYHTSVYLNILDFKSKVIATFVRKNLQRGIKEGLYKDSLSVIQFEDAFMNVLGLIFSHGNTNMKLEYNQTLEFFFNLFVYGLLSIKGLDRFEYLRNNTVCWRKIEFRKIHE